MVLYCIVMVHVEAGCCRDDGLGVVGEVGVGGYESDRREQLLKGVKANPAPQRIQCPVQAKVAPSTIASRPVIARQLEVYLTHALVPL